MKLQDFFYYVLTSFIWGSTWLAITYQLGEVEPLVSIFYRFFAAALFLFLYCYVKRLDMHFSMQDHFFIFLQGVFLFGINYWLVYISETLLTSGLVAVIFSTIVFFNIINGAIFLRLPIQRRMTIGALLGLTGILLIFKREVTTASLAATSVRGMAYAFIGALSASLGNIVSARNSKIGIPVVQSNAFGMFYGALFIFLLVLGFNKPITMSQESSYIFSLIYLALFGSVIAFGAYLTLIGHIGADKAGYTTLVIPVIALFLSTFFEGYRWSLSAGAGVVLVVFGNLMIMKKKKKAVVCLK